MDIGFIGLGKMGKNMVLMLTRKGHKVVAYNRSPQSVEEVAKEGAVAAYTLRELCEKLPTPRTIWMMVPSSNVDSVMNELLPLMSKGDLLIDGGNSNYRITLKRKELIESFGIRFMDAGVSGGLVAAKLGYCIMMGGNRLDFEKIEPIVKDMCVDEGYLFCGSHGSGHFVKMTHNAIEYGMMQAIGEGFELLEKGPYKELDFHKISHLWNHGSIIRGFLMEMTENAFSKDPRLDSISGHIEDTGEGMWAIQEAMEFKVPFAVNTQALFERYRSRNLNPLSNRVVAAQRDEFGGHGVKKRQ